MKSCRSLLPMLACAACGVVFSGTLLAQSTPFPMDASSRVRFFAEADKNHDGVLSRSEIPSGLHDLRAHFDQYDIDNNHQLSKAEFSIYLASLEPRMFRPPAFHVGARTAASR
jgi:hypothetical protein